MKKNKNIIIRMSEQDVKVLNELSDKLQQSKSETIRKLIKNAFNLY